MNKLMELMISSLLIRVPTIITYGIIALEFYALFSKRFPMENFFKIRKWFALTRYVMNFIAIIIICYFKFYDVALFISIIMFSCVINDILFYIIEKFISEK